MKNIKTFNEMLEGFPMLAKELDSEQEEFGKIEALKYLVRHAKCGDEWCEAGMYDALKFVIQSPNESFLKDYLNDLIEKATNN